MTTPADDPDVYAWTHAQAQALPTTDGPLLEVAHLVAVIERIGMHETRARRSPM